MPMSFRYNYGQTVTIVTSAPPLLKPGTCVAVVGMRELNREHELLNVRYPPRTQVYTIEYDDGTSVEVPEKYIEPVGAKNPPDEK